MSSDKIIEHEESKDNPFNKYFKKISPMSLGILLVFFTICVVYFVGFDNLEEGKYYLIGGGLLILFIFLMGNSTKGQKVDYETAQDLLERYLTKRLTRVRHGLKEGEVIISPKGYCQLYGDTNYHIIYFYIRDYEEGFKQWYIGRISKEDGSFCGCQDCPGDISGEPPIDYGKLGGEEKDDD